MRPGYVLPGRLLTRRNPMLVWQRRLSQFVGYLFRARTRFCPALAVSTGNKVGLGSHTPRAEAGLALADSDACKVHTHAACHPCMSCAGGCVSWHGLPLESPWPAPCSVPQSGHHRLIPSTRIDNFQGKHTSKVASLISVNREALWKMSCPSTGTVSNGLTDSYTYSSGGSRGGQDNAVDLAVGRWVT
jgi:hypothetical protein